LELELQSLHFVMIYPMDHLKTINVLFISTMELHYNNIRWRSCETVVTWSIQMHQAII
jgi:hypothetical protein